jgi:hypothetical protein
MIQNRVDAERVATLLQTRDDIDEATRQAMIGDLRNFHNSQVSQAQELESATSTDWWEQTKRKTGIVAEQAAIGVGDTIDFLASPLTYGAYRVGQMTGLVDADRDYFGDEGFGDVSGLIDRSIDGYDPITRTEQIIAGLARAGGGAIGGVGMGRSLVATGMRGLTQGGKFLSAQPVVQVGSAFSGEALRQVAEAQDMGMGWQMGYALAGGLGYGAFAPGAWNSIARSAVGLKRGGTAAADDAVARLNDELASINKMNEEFSMMSGFEQGPGYDFLARLPEDSFAARMLRNVPGARGHFDDAINSIEKQVEGLLEAQTKVVAKTRRGNTTVLGRPDEATAGLALKKGMEGVVDDFKATAKQRFDELDAVIPDQLEVPTSNLSRFFSTRNRNEWQEVLGSDTIAALEEAFQSKGISFHEWMKRMNPAGVAEELEPLLQGVRVLSYRQMRDLRTKIGELMSEPSLLLDARQGELARIYGALSDDIDTGLQLLDSRKRLGIGEWEPVAPKMRDTNEWYSERRGILDDELAFMTQKVTNEAVPPEKLFAALWSNSKGAASTVAKLKHEFINAGRRSDWDHVASAAIRKLGTAPAGQQGATGARFSLETFLTRWNQLGDEAKKALFSGMKSSGQKGDLYSLFSDLAVVAERGRTFKQGRAGRDISQMLVAGGPLGGVAGSIATGNPVWLLSALMAGAGAKGAAMLMTSPKWVNAVRNLSTKKTISPSALAALIGDAGSEHPEAAAQMLENLKQMMISDYGRTTDSVLERYE